MGHRGGRTGSSKITEGPEQLAMLQEEAVIFPEVHAFTIASALFPCQPFTVGPELHELPQGLFRRWVVGERVGDQPEHLSTRPTNGPWAPPQISLSSTFRAPCWVLNSHCSKWWSLPRCRQSQSLPCPDHRLKAHSHQGALVHYSNVLLSKHVLRSSFCRPTGQPRKKGGS